MEGAKGEGSLDRRALRARRIGELPLDLDLMAVPPSAAGGGPQEEDVAFNFATCNSRGEGGSVDLDRRLAELHAAADAAAVELDAVKRMREAGERDLLIPRVPIQAASGFGPMQKLQEKMSHLRQGIGKVYSDLKIKSIADREGRCDLDVGCIQRKFQQMAIVKLAKDNVSGVPVTFGQYGKGNQDVVKREVILKDLISKVYNIVSELEVLKGSCRLEMLYHAEDMLSALDVISPQENGKRNSQLAFTASEDCKNSCGLLKNDNDEILQSERYLNEPVHKGSNTNTEVNPQYQKLDYVEERNSQPAFTASEDCKNSCGLLKNDNDEILQSERYLKEPVHKGSNTNTEVNPQYQKLDYVEESDVPSFGSSDSSDFDSDTDICELYSKPRQDSLRVSTTERRLQFAALIDKRRQPNKSYLQSEDRSLSPLPPLDFPLQMNSEMGNTTTSSSSSSSSSGGDSPIKMNDLGEICASGCRLATDDEENDLMMEAASCVGEDTKAMEIICMHDEECHRLAMLSTATQGIPRDLLLEQLIVFFAKEQDVTSCRVCISDFRTTDRCIRLSCRHIFHMQCIVKWLLEKDTCPVCRGIVSSACQIDECLLSHRLSENTGGVPS